MIERYIRDLLGGDANAANISTIALAVITGIGWLVSLVPPYVAISFWTLIGVPLLWAIVFATITFHPVRKVMASEKAAEERLKAMPYYHRLALGQYQNMPDELKSQVTPVTMEDLEPLGEDQTMDLYRSLNNLNNAWERQQKLLRSPHVEKMVEEINSLEERFTEENKTLAERS